MNAYRASIRWFLDIDNLTLSDHRAFLQHLDVLTVRAMHEHFRDSAHIEYDLAIRRLAETQGFAAFGSENNGISVTYYGAQNIRPKSTKPNQNSIRSPNEHMKDRKRPCFRWNKDYGCTRSEEDCGFGHWCAKCGSKNHKKLTCTKD